MTSPRPPVILDFDGSVTLEPQDGARVIPLQTWQESIRFGCRWTPFKQLEQTLATELPVDYGCVFTGSGDYHHVTQLLLQQLAYLPAFDLVVCDNHPDNMRYPFGIHCGSWIYWASRLPQVQHIHVLGICSPDIALGHAWENHWSPLLRNKLTYWNINVDTRWLKWMGAGDSSYTFGGADALMKSFLARLDKERSRAVYLSLDKDVLSPSVINTNWDQGQLHEHHLNPLIDACKGRLIGADITGDVSSYRYQSRFKRWLSAADGQQVPAPEQAASWQERQNQLNRRLAARIGTCW